MRLPFLDVLRQNVFLFGNTLLLLAPSLTFAQDTITNAMSQVVSYQYFDSLNSTEANFLNSPDVSYYFQFRASLGGTVLHGHVTDTTGVPLVGATVSATIYLQPVAQTTTDASGNYELPSVSAGNYDLSAWDATHQTSMRGLTLSANTAEQDFQLKPMPPSPAMQKVNRQPTLSYTSGPQGAMLNIFDGTQFVPVTAGNTPPTDCMTIVLTHGWILTDPLTGNPVFTPSGIADWPTTLAATLRSNGITARIATILAWDWHVAAEGLVPPQANTPGQGVALGSNLLAALGPNYSFPIHFFGHSLGTMVNAAAINFLHADQVPSTQGEVSPTPWPTTGEPFIHVTLFDEADEATSGTTQSQLFFDGNTLSQSGSSELLSLDNDSSLIWSPPLPINYTWADNYVSLVGFYHANAVNILLQHGFGLLGPVGAHSYGQQWYGQSVSNPTDASNPLGFQNSYEYLLKNGLPLSGIPPSELSDAYYQTSSLDPLALAPIPFGLGAVTVDAYGTVVGGTLDVGSSVFGSTGAMVVTGIDGAVQFKGNVSTVIQDVTQQAGQTISQGLNYIDSVATQGGQTVLNLMDSSASLQLLLTTRAGMPVSLANPNLPQPLEGPSGSNVSNTPAMAWVPVNFPANATAMAFDFTLSGNPAEDSLVCGIDTNNLFSLQAEYIPTNSISTSSLIDVSAWAGTTNELFFGLLGCTSSNATLEIDNIRFYSLVPPSLNIQLSNGIVTLAWALSANNYVLEQADNLSTTNAWLLVTNVPVIENAQYELTNGISGCRHFYRLKQM